MKSPIVLRRTLDAERQRAGVYRCRACGAFIPLGFAHRRDHDGTGCVVQDQTGDAGASSATRGEVRQ